MQNGISDDESLDKTTTSQAAPNTGGLNEVKEYTNLVLFLLELVRLDKFRAKNQIYHKYVYSRGLKLTLWFFFLVSAGSLLLRSDKVVQNLYLQEKT